MIESGFNASWENIFHAKIIEFSEVLLYKFNYLLNLLKIRYLRNELYIRNCLINRLYLVKSNLSDSNFVLN
jgi:hypothetical protein